MAVGTNENSSQFRDVNSKTETMITCVALTASMNIEFLLPSSINSNRCRAIPQGIKQWHSSETFVIFGLQNATSQ